MRTAAIAVVALCLGWILAGGGADAPHAAIPAEKGIEVYFSPNGGAQDAIVDVIRNARRSIDVQVYYFTNSVISRALIDAHQRGVKVRCILDPSQRTTRYSSATPLFNAGIPVMIDAQHASAHSKVVLVDGEVIITGSFNFTRTAETENVENLLIIRDHPKLYAAYHKNFEEHLRHSEKYDGVLRE